MALQQCVPRGVPAATHALAPTRATTLRSRAAATDAAVKLSAVDRVQLGDSDLNVSGAWQLCRSAAGCLTCSSPPALGPCAPPAVCHQQRRLPLAACTVIIAQCAVWVP
jgi:hypothetical protein